MPTRRRDGKNNLLGGVNVDPQDVARNNMPTQYETDLVAEHGSGMQDFINSERGRDGKNNLLSGVNVDPQDVARITSGFQSSPYGGQNVVNAVNGTPSYNYSDPYGARTSIEERLGLAEATAAEQAAQAGLTGFQDTTRAQINKLRDNRDLSTGLETGFEAKRTREATQQEQVLANELQLAQTNRLALDAKVADEYGIYQSERAIRQNALLQAIQNGAKNVNIGMSLEDITKASVEAQEKQAEEAEKKAYKDSVKDQLRAMGSSTKGLSINELERKLKKKIKASNEYDDMIKDLEVQAKRKALRDSTTEDKELADFDKYLEKQKSILEKAASEDVDDGAWARAWGNMQSAYPFMSPEQIDEALGLTYRRQIEGQ